MTSGEGDLKKLGALGTLAETRGMQAGPGGYLPKVGTVLTRGVSIDAAVHGPLAEGRDGIVAVLRYERRSDDHTYTEHLTAVITKVPESIGFAPYLAFGGGGGHIGLTQNSESREVDNVRLRVAKGVDQSWLVELMAPTMVDWLSRSSGSWGFELADGVLVTLRDGQAGNAKDLETLCADAVKLADAIRKQAIQDAAGGQAGRTAAVEEDGARQSVRIQHFLPRVSFEQRQPKDVADAIPVYQSLIKAAPVTYISGLGAALMWTIGISVIAGGLYGLLLTVGDPLTNAIIWEGGLFLLVSFFVLRSRINGDAKLCAEEAFYEEYARSRKLTPAPPLKFAATHAEADLPGKPVRVFEGAFTSAEAGLVTGALMLTGDGLERDQWIALVAGPRGPTAKTELKPSQPGVSAAYLDKTIEELLLDIVTTPEQPAG